MGASLSISAPVSGTPLLISDTSTGLPSISSRVMTIYGPTGLLLSTINMGASLTANYAVTEDQWVRFVLTLNSGAYVAVVDYLADGFYYQALINQSKTGCGCGENSLCSDTAKAMMADKAARFFTLYDFNLNADTAIKAADTLIL